MMITALGMAALALAPCAALYVRKGWSAQKSLPFSLCAQSLILYSFGLFLPFSCCAAILCVICLTCWGYFGVRARSWRRMRGFFNAPALLFLLGAPLLFAACRERLYLSYDEYSHWGRIIKVIAMYDALPRAGEGAALLLYDYPPIGAMLPALCAAVMGYGEGVAYFGYAMLIWGLLLGCVPEKGGFLYQTLCAAVLFLVLMALFPFALLRLFSEPLIALLFALLVIRTKGSEQGEKTRMDHAYTPVLVACLALTKNTALLFAALYLLARFCDRPCRKEAVRCAALFACAAAAFASYAIYGAVHGVGSVFSGHIGPNIAALWTGTASAHRLSVPARFAAQFFAAPFPQNDVYYTYGVGVSAAVMYAALGAAAGAYVYVSRSRRAQLRRMAGLFLGALGYFLFILTAYMLVFSEEEAEKLTEFFRYMSLPLLWLALIIGAQALDGLSVRGKRVRIGAALLALTLLLPLSHPDIIYRTLVTHETVQDTVWARADTARIAALVRAQPDADGTDEKPAKIALIGSADAMALEYELLAQADWGGAAHDWNKAAHDFTAQGIEKMLADGGFDYVVTGRLENDDPARVVDARYADLFAGGEAAMAPFTLYRVEKSDHALRLIHVATAEESITGG